MISFINSVANFDYVQADLSSDTVLKAFLFSPRYFLDDIKNASLVPCQKYNPAVTEWVLLPVITGQ